MTTGNLPCQTKFNNTEINKLYIDLYSKVHIYLDTGTIFIILAAVQNLFKLQLYNGIWA